MCWPLGGLWHIFRQDKHVLALHGPNGCKIIIGQIIPKNEKGFWHCQVLIIQITLGHSFSSWGVLQLMMSWQFYFIYDLFMHCFFFYINLKNVCVNVVKQNAKVLDKELNLLWLGFLWMVFNMLLAFHINLINRKCCIQHTYAIFFINFSNTLRVSMCSG